MSVNNSQSNIPVQNRSSENVVYQALDTEESEYHSNCYYEDDSLSRDKYMKTSQSTSIQESASSSTIYNTNYSESSSTTPNSDCSSRCLNSVKVRDEVVNNSIKKVPYRSKCKIFRSSSRSNGVSSVATNSYKDRKEYNNQESYQNPINNKQIINDYNNNKNTKHFIHRNDLDVSNYDVEAAQGDEESRMVSDVYVKRSFKRSTGCKRTGSLVCKMHANNEQLRIASTHVKPRKSSFSLSKWRRKKTLEPICDNFQQLDSESLSAARCGCERIRINVSGHFFETRAAVLERHPDTMLGNPRKRQKYYDHTRDEVFLDRHRPSFEAIFSYYQYGGKLKRPHHVHDDIFLSELMFYELEPEVVEEYKRAEGYTTEKIEVPNNKTLRWLWMLFEYPETSRAAFLVALISVAMTLVSIILFCVETLPHYAGSHCENDEAPNFLDAFFIIETICTVWFTFEVIIRFVASPSKLRFLKDFKNIVDVTAIVPYYITLINVLSTMSCASAKSSASLAFLRVIRLIRVFKLTKHSVGLQVLVLTFKASIEGLGLFLVALIVCLLVFSSAIYYAELGNTESQMESIPDAFWWAIITMTTVGYGDKVPVGYWGKLIGAACAITGVLTLAIPVPIITGHFNRFYAHKTGRGRHV